MPLGRKPRKSWLYEEMMKTYSCSDISECLLHFVLSFIKETEKRGERYHEYAGCPSSNLEYSEMGLGKGCLLCRLLRIIEEMKLLKEGGESK